MVNAIQAEIRDSNSHMNNIVTTKRAIELEVQTNSLPVHLTLSFVA